MNYEQDTQELSHSPVTHPALRFSTNLPPALALVAADSLHLDQDKAVA